MRIFITIIVLAGTIFSCEYGQKSSAEKNRSCTCDLTELEIIRNDSICWNRAGANLEVFSSELGDNIDTLSCGHQIQDELDKLAKKGGGSLIVPPGRYIIKQPVMIPSGISVVGVSRDSTVFEIRMTEKFEKSKHWMKPKGNSAAFLFDGVRNASLENATLIYKAVDFEPLDFDSYDHEWDNRVFHEMDPKTEDLFVTSVWFENAENCVLTHCNILKSGNDPVRIRNSRHITCSFNFIDQAYNKGSGGAGYYNLINSRYCLLFRETIRRIRHLSIHKRSSYNVVHGCDLQVDVNFHSGDLGHNLVENNLINIPVWHSWRTIGTGAASMHHAPGPYNVLFNNKTDYKNTGPELDPDKLFFMCDYFPDSSLGLEKFVETEYASFFPEGIFNPGKSVALKKK